MGNSPSRTKAVDENIRKWRQEGGLDSRPVHFMAPENPRLKSPLNQPMNARRYPSVATTLYDSSRFRDNTSSSNFATSSKTPTVGSQYYGSIRHESSSLPTSTRPTSSPLLRIRELSQRESVATGESPFLQDISNVDDDYELDVLSHALGLSFVQQKIEDFCGRDNQVQTASTECITCLEDLPLSSFPNIPITSSCNHPTDDQICKNCLGRSFKAQLDGGIGHGSFTCPLCRNPLSDLEVRRWAPPDIAEKFYDLQTRNALSNDPNFIWCSNVSCGAGQIHTSGSDAPIVRCNDCGAKTCFVHQRPWHSGLTCYEYDHPEEVSKGDRRVNQEMVIINQREEDIRDQIEGDRAMAQRLEAQEFKESTRWELKGRLRLEEAARKQAQEARETARRNQQEFERRQRDAKVRERAKRRQEEQLGEKEAIRISKLCPGEKCSYRVYRDGGCRHITCTRCHHEWCWDCRKHWVTGHLHEKCA